MFFSLLLLLLHQRRCRSKDGVVVDRRNEHGVVVVGVVDIGVVVMSAFVVVGRDRDGQRVGRRPLVNASTRR